NLAANPAIQYGDPILIFFAGHGTRYRWSKSDDLTDFKEEHDVSCSQKFVEALCPIDHNTLDTSGSIVTDITDREINGILGHVTKKKGSRITFVLDCCHAGSVT
ncbi:hypothetical protein F5146DRAFT_932645, partial [Armillaria mellea]